MDTSVIEEPLSLIQDIGCGGEFLSQPYTLHHFREMWQPTVSSWNNFFEWESAGSHDTVKRANKIWQERLEKAPESLFDDETDKDLQRFIASRQ
jgi:trimethylamine:corrinoid methyltransferase-like protein